MEKKIKKEMNTFKKLTDETLMPWGVYKDDELQDVPAKYLLWLEDQIKHKNNTKDPFRNGLLVYIEENRDVLEKELKQIKSK